MVHSSHYRNLQTFTLLRSIFGTASYSLTVNYSPLFGMYSLSSYAQTHFTVKPTSSFDMENVRCFSIHLLITALER
jgi:hypothetical protein